MRPVGLKGSLMKRTIIFALLLGVCLLCGCEKPKAGAPGDAVSTTPPAVDATAAPSPTPIGYPLYGEPTLTFDSLIAFEAAIKSENADEAYGLGLSGLAYYYIPSVRFSPAPDSIAVGDGFIRVVYSVCTPNPEEPETPDQLEAFRLNNETKLEWSREKNGASLLAEAITALGLREFSEGVYYREIKSPLVPRQTISLGFYWVAEGHLINFDLPVRAHVPTLDNIGLFTALIKKPLIPSAATVAAGENVTLAKAGVEQVDISPGLRATAELARPYTFKEALDTTFLYNNQMFLDYAGGRKLTPREFVEFRDSVVVVVTDKDNEWYGTVEAGHMSYLQGFSVDENGELFHEEEGYNTFAWGPLFADINGDGNDEVCYLQNNHTGSEFARMVVYEKIDAGYAERLYIWTGRDTFYVIDAGGFVCLASTGPDYESVNADDPDADWFARIEIRLLAFNEDWSAEGIIISGGEIEPPTDEGIFTIIAEEGRFETALVNRNGG